MYNIDKLQAIERVHIYLHLKLSLQIMKRKFKQ